MRVVIKVGTSVISPEGKLEPRVMRDLVDQMSLNSHEYILVSSGAIAAGMEILNTTRRPKEISLMQACAAIGQNALMYTYKQVFFGKKVVAQVLLTSDDFTSRVRYNNLRNTLKELLRMGILPIINENDTVSVRELRGAFGDNDELSALVARGVEADWLIILTDVDGLCTVDPRKGKGKCLAVVREITHHLEKMCGGNSAQGRGGMLSKLRAARLATESGTHVSIVNGTKPGVIHLALERKAGTFFPGRGRREQRRAKDPVRTGEDG